MNKRKIFAVILSGILALNILAACGKQETEEETTTTETTTAAPDYTVWRQAYSDYLMTVFAGEETLVGYEYETEDCRFSLVDFNGDDIPELLISEGEYASSSVNFYTYNGYEVIYSGAAGVNGNVNYDLQTGVIFAQSTIEDGEKYQETTTSYIFDGEKLNVQWQGCSVTEDESLVPVDYTVDNGDAVTYYSDDEEITREEYAAFMGTYIPEGYNTVGRDGYELTQDNVIAVVENGEEPAEETTESAVAVKDYEFTGYMSDEVKNAFADVLSGFIENNSENADAAGAVFSFADVDSDGTQEMIISTGIEKGSTADIYKVSGGEAVCMCSAGSYGVAGYAKGIIVGNYSGSGADYYYIYEVDGTKADEIHSVCAYSEDFNTSDFDPADATGWMVDGEEATQEEYTAITDEYVTDSLVWNTADGEPGTAAYGYACTAENLTAVLSVG